jgi:hypothetical protein
MVTKYLRVPIIRNDDKKIHNIPKKILAKRTKPFVLQQGVLYRFGQHNWVHQLLQSKQMSTILQELHGSIVGGHFFYDIIVRKILDVSFWWLMMNRNVHEYC